MAAGFFLAGCSYFQRDRIVNLSHLEHLYTTVEIDTQTVAGVIRIYCEYPDYEFAIEPNEGFTCVDDVARAVILMGQAPSFPEGPAREGMRSLLPEFILAMQADNGYFYNFLWGDLSINKTYRTSLPRPDWWSWRAFWALESYPVTDEVTAARSRQAINTLTGNVFDEYLDKPMTFMTVEGVRLPEWIAHGTAADQSSLLIVALSKYYRRTGEQRALVLIDKFARGLLIMQKGDSTSFPYGAYMSWKNKWHAYGNLQAYSMLKAGQLLEKEEYISSALLEIDHFYPYLINRDYLSYFSIRYDDSAYEIIEEQQFPQIAYGFRPMIYATLEAYEVTGNVKYLKMAEKIASWFTGSNPAGAVMYDRATGRCYDGIIDEENINLNSGAESTIEALLSMQALSRYPEINLKCSDGEAH